MAILGLIIIIHGLAASLWMTVTEVTDWQVSPAMPGCPTALITLQELLGVFRIECMCSHAAATYSQWQASTLWCMSQPPAVGAPESGVLQKKQDTRVTMQKREYRQRCKALNEYVVRPRLSFLVMISGLQRVYRLLSVEPAVASIKKRSRSGYGCLRCSWALGFQNSHSMIVRHCHCTKSVFDVGPGRPAWFEDPANCPVQRHASWVTKLVSHAHRSHSFVVICGHLWLVVVRVFCCDAFLWLLVWQPVAGLA